MTPLAIIIMALLLASCQTAQDRQWRDMQTILEHTQPSQNVR